MQKGFVRLWFTWDARRVRLVPETSQRWVRLADVTEIIKVTTVKALADETGVSHEGLHALDGDSACDRPDLCSLLVLYPVYLLWTEKGCAAAHCNERIFLDKILNETKEGSYSF